MANRPKIRFTTRASREIEAAAFWYEEQRSGLGSEFMRSFEARLASIQRAPLLFAETHRKDVRRALMKRFPYGVFFRTSEDFIDIISVFHTRRNPEQTRFR